MGQQLRRSKSGFSIVLLCVFGLSKAPAIEMVVTQVDKSIELLDVDPQETEDDGAVVVLDSKRKGKRIVIKTLTRQTYFLPVFGLVDPEKLKPGDLVGVNKDSYLILETLPADRAVFGHWRVGQANPEID